MGLERGKKIPGYIDRQAREAKLGNSDFYAGPTVAKRANRGEMVSPEHHDDSLEKQMLRCESAAAAKHRGAGTRLMQRLQRALLKRQRPKPQRNL